MFNVLNNFRIKPLPVSSGEKTWERLSKKAGKKRQKDWIIEQLHALREAQLYGKSQ